MEDEQEFTRLIRTSELPGRGNSTNTTPGLKILGGAREWPEPSMTGPSEAVIKEGRWGIGEVAAEDEV